MCRFVIHFNILLPKRLLESNVINSFSFTPFLSSVLEERRGWGEWNWTTKLSKMFAMSVYNCSYCLWRNTGSSQSHYLKTTELIGNSTYWTGTARNYWIYLLSKYLKNVHSLSDTVLTDLHIQTVLITIVSYVLLLLRVYKRWSKRIEHGVNKLSKATKPGGGNLNIWSNLFPAYAILWSTLALSNSIQ